MGHMSFDHYSSVIHNTGKQNLAGRISDPLFSRSMLSSKYFMFFPRKYVANVTTAYLYPVGSPYCRVYSLCRLHSVRPGDNTGHPLGRDSHYDTNSRFAKTGKT